jgi:hypothetical protein
MDIIGQAKELVVWGCGKETADLCEMIRRGNSHEHALRSLPQESIEVNPHRKVSRTADAARSDANDGKTGDSIAAAGKSCLAIG